MVSGTVNILLGLVFFSCAALPSPAQISFSSAIGLALQNSSRVKIAHDDVNKALAALAETRDVYVPSVTGSGGLPGAFYGISTTVPTIFTISAQSLAFSYSQHNYIRAATMSLNSSRLALEDVTQQIEEDTAITYLSLDSALHQMDAMVDEYGFSNQLVSVVQDRLNAGLENQLELKKSRRTSVQIKLQQLQLEDELASLREHLGKLIGLPSEQFVTVPDSIPGNPVRSASLYSESYPDSPAVLSAEANAKAKQEQAFGDSRYAGRPQMMFQAQYGRISPLNNVSGFYNLRGNYNTVQVGVQIQLSFLDKAHRAKVRESQADAMHAAHEAEFLKDQQSENRMKLQRSLSELSTRAELAGLDQGIAQDQLDAIVVELGSGRANSSAPPMTPKDEAKAHIQERQKYLDVLAANLQLREGQISYLRQTEELEDWLRSLTIQAPVFTKP